MGAGDSKMRDVELVESVAGEAGVVDGGPPDAGTAPPRGFRRRLKFRRLWWLGVLGLVLVVTAPTAVANLRENARLAALGDVPGFLAPLNGPVHVIWHADATVSGGMAPVSGRLLIVKNRPGESVEVVALDPLTGRPAWRAPLVAPETYKSATCGLPPAQGSSGTASKNLAIGCVVQDESATATVTTTDNETVSLVYPTKAHLVVLDGTTGTQIASRAVEPTTTVALLGTDLIISHVDAGGYIHVERQDPRSEAVRWTYTSPEAVPVDAFGQRSATVTVVADLIFVNCAGVNNPASVGINSANSTWVLSGEGVVLRSWAADPKVSSTTDIFRVDALNSHLLAERAVSGPGASGTKVINLATGASFTADGNPVGGYPDDASIPDLALMVSGDGSELIAYDGASGNSRWRARGVASPPVVLDGHVLRLTGSTLEALDGRTGALVWSTPLQQAESSSLVTDGRVALVTQSGPAGGTVFTAYGLDDGAPRWTTSIPDDVFPNAVGGRLYGISGQQIVALG